MSEQRVKTELQKPVTLDNKDENFSRFVKRGQVIHIHNEASVFCGVERRSLVCKDMPFHTSAALRVLKNAAHGHRPTLVQGCVF